MGGWKKQLEGSAHLNSGGCLWREAKAKEVLKYEERDLEQLLAGLGGHLEAGGVGCGASSIKSTLSEEHSVGHDMRSECT